MTQPIPSVFTMTPNTVTLDIVLYQEQFGDVRLLPARIDGEGIYEQFDADVAAVDAFFERIASRYADQRDSIAIGNVPPPNDDGTLHVYRIGAVDVTPDAERVLDARFDKSERGYHILGKTDGGEIPTTA